MSRPSPLALSANDAIGATLIVTNCPFAGNQSNVRGAGYREHIQKRYPTVTNSAFFGNSAIFGGGAISQAAGSVTVKNSIPADQSTEGADCYQRDRRRRLQLERRLSLRIHCELKPQRCERR